MLKAIATYQYYFTIYNIIQLHTQKEPLCMFCFRQQEAKSYRELKKHEMLHSDKRYLISTILKNMLKDEYTTMAKKVLFNPNFKNKSKLFHIIEKLYDAKKYLVNIEYENMTKNQISKFIELISKYLKNCRFINILNNYKKFETNHSDTSMAHYYYYTLVHDFLSKYKPINEDKNMVYGVDNEVLIIFKRCFIL